MIQVVVGAQFGSEAKGHLVQRLAEKAVEDGHTLQVIRVAGPNAGHTGHDADGIAYALRQIPVAAVVEGKIDLVVGPGSEIDLPVLATEIKLLSEAGLLRNKRIWVSPEATMIEDHHKDAEGDSELVERVGSTGKGIGAARADRLMRTAQRVADHVEAKNFLLNFDDAEILIGAPPFRTNVTIVEGTQGYGLGLHAGFYPQCTSSDCRAIDFLAMAGVDPWFEPVEVHLVARIYPIRVAGNSGPLLGETSWEALGLDPELTTVTKKVRRVGSPDWELVRRAVDANGRTRSRLHVTMLDQMFPEVAGVTGYNGLSSAAQAYLQYVRAVVDVDIEGVGTGPNSWCWL